MMMRRTTRKRKRRKFLDEEAIEQKKVQEEEEDEEGQEEEAEVKIKKSLTNHKTKQTDLAGYFTKVKSQAADREAETREQTLTALAIRRKTAQKSLEKATPGPSADARESARWMESAARQDDALNKEGKLLTLVTGKSGRERKVIMTECVQQKGGKKGGKSKSAKKGDKPKSPKASNKLSCMIALID